MSNRSCRYSLAYAATAVLAGALALVLWPEFLPNLIRATCYPSYGQASPVEPGLVHLHLITDSFIGASFLAIAATLGYLLLKGRRFLPFHGLFIAVGILIVASGAAQLAAVWTHWAPQYWLSGIVKLITATAAVVTAAALPALIPSIIRIINSARVSEERGLELHTRTLELRQLNSFLQEEMTVRKNAEEQLQDAHTEALLNSERRYHTFAEIAPVGIFHTDATGKHIYVNETWCQITGLKWIDAPFDVWSHVLHPDDKQRIIEAWTKNIARDADFKSEFRFLRPDGAVVWVIGQARAERNSVGEVVGYVGTVTDITHRKQTEEALERFIEESRRANDELSFYKFALDQAAIVAVTDPGGTIKYVNDKFCQISGYSREELLEQNHRLLNSGYHPKSFFKEMYGTIARGKVWRGEIRNRANDGHIYWVDTTIIPTKNAEGKITQYVAIRADITERKKAEAALEANRKAVEVANMELAQTNERLSALYQTAQRFVDDVSHEFRTPLSVIKGYSEIMRDGLAGPLSPKQKQFTQLIVDRTSDMAQMVDDLLDTSKLRAGSLRVDRKPSDVPAIFSTVRSMIEDRANNSKVKLVFKVEPNLPQVFADAEKVCRIIVNLAINAIKFSPENAPVTIWANLGDDGDIHIGVTDEGPGISSENLAAIFQRFRQIGEAPSNTKGFGLGLNIAKELVALNFGRMNVSSEIQQGSTFSFTLPVNDPRIIISRLFDHLEAAKVPDGQLALLRVTSTPPGVALADLRGYLASSVHPADVILTAPDGNSLILFGYSTDPLGWHQNLVDAGARIKSNAPSQKLCAFNTELLATWYCPSQRDAALNAVLEELLGVHAHA